ncbi:MAG: polyphosphate kinase 2 family protein [Candidatus Kapaibacterium sp.]|jgi:PPK2 family polyphosphate:nucleotide phosphotransferase
MNSSKFLVPTNGKFRLKDHSPAFTDGYKNKAHAETQLSKNIDRLSNLQERLYAQNTYGVLIILQAMDTAGKDGVIEHVMSGVNPQGVDVFSFKAPTTYELDHDFMWRSLRVLPERGKMGIFNRSYYEEVIVTKVHPEILEAERIPTIAKGAHLWNERYEDINNIERYLVRNGIIVLKFFLHLSRAEQKGRLLERIETPEKNYKMSVADITERAHWKAYMTAYEEMLRNTSTEWAPWHVIPADHKWFTRISVSDTIIQKLESLKLTFPTLDKQGIRNLRTAKRILEKD